MQGFPKTLNTREDFEFVRSNFAKELWAPEFQALLDSNYGWFFVKELGEDEPGVIDDTHKVEEQRDTSGEAEKVVRYQFEYREVENSKLKRLGYSVSEVQTLLQ